MNTAFLGAEGITSTSANHLCNLAKEKAYVYQAELQNLSFYDTFVSINGDKQILLSKSSDDYVHLMGLISKIGQLHAFIAYMREAIKQKQNLSSEIPPFQDWEGSKEIPTVDLFIPTTWEEVFAELSIKDQNKYLELEAICAVLGKNIHPGGAINNARQEMYAKLSRPAEISDNKVYSYDVTVDPHKVDELFFALQREHRSYEAQLNAMKNSIEAEVTARNLAKQEIYHAKLRERAAKTKEQEAAYKVYVDRLKAEHSKMKIVIPNALQEIYKELSDL